MRRVKKVFILSALAAGATLSCGSVTASAVPPDETLPQSCHGSIVSGTAQEFGGVGQLGAQPGDLGQTQQTITETCKLTQG